MGEIQIPKVILDAMQEQLALLQKAVDRLTKQNQQKDERIGELEQARIKNTYWDYLNKLSKFDLLAIDDFGLMDLDLDKCRDLFEVIDGSDGHKSTIIISQFPVKSWFDMFADGTYADACLARITDKKRAFRLEMNGKSMREPV